MIRLNLQMFGGGGSGANTGPNGKSQSTTKEALSHSHGHGSAGGRGMDGGAPERVSSRKGEPVHGNIVKTETYEVYVVSHLKEKLVGSMSGKDILEKYVYNPRLETWTERQLGELYRERYSRIGIGNGKYVIRRVRK